jgi:hypothetical protein
MSHVRYQQAVAENLLGDMCNQRKRSLSRTADTEERLNKAPHFLYHYVLKKHDDFSVQQLEGQGSQKTNISVVRSV